MLFLKFYTAKVRILFGICKFFQLIDVKGFVNLYLKAKRNHIIVINIGKGHFIYKCFFGTIISICIKLDKCVVIIIVF